MTQAKYDVCAVGNAIVDVLAPCDPAFLTAQGLTAGSMQLVDADQSAALYAAMQAGVEASGGSAARPISARSRTISWAASSATTSAPPGSPSTPPR